METLEETLKVILEKALNLATQTGEFVMEQAPDLLQQFFMWHTWRHGLGIALGFFIIIFTLIMPSIWSDKEGDCRFMGRYFNENGQMEAIIVSVLGFLTGFITICIHTYKFVYITVAPKLYLIDYFLGGRPC